ncbi:hypothetical protein [Undibacterium sp. TC9W]|uniref:hypothetical protein n=1 Tax=Undibacterium sp. TC9W TaxID=3413053 RepID=UPI003BEF7E1F
MQISKHKQVLLIAWLLTLSVWLPPIWYYFFQTDYFMYGFRGLQNFLHASIYLLTILGWTVFLSIPKYRTEKVIIGAGASFLTIGFLLNTFAMFKQTPGFLIMFAGFLLVQTLRGETFKQSGSAGDEPAVKVSSGRNWGLIYSVAAITFLGTPWLWVRLGAPELFISNVRGLLDLAISGPFLIIMAGWALWFCFPSNRTVNANCAAASAMLVIALFLSWYFSYAGSVGFWLLAMGWMGSAYFRKNAVTSKAKTAS